MTTPIKHRMPLGELWSYLEPLFEQVTTNSHEFKGNHVECGDTKGRLYISYKLGTYLAWCHNCHAYGVYRQDTRPIYNQHTTYNHSPEGKEIATISTFEYYWNDSTNDIDKVAFSKKVRWFNWLAMNVCDAGHLDNVPESWSHVEPLCTAYGIRFRRDSGNPVFPIFVEGDEVPVLMQERLYIKAPEGKPKWITYYKGENGDSVPAIALDNRYDNKHSLVICEDRLSSIKCSEAGLAAIALRGTHLSDHTLAAIVLGEWERIFIWLDNDSEQVYRQALDIQRRLDLYVRNTHGFDVSPGGPKALTQTGIKDKVTSRGGHVAGP